MAGLVQQAAVGLVLQQLGENSFCVIKVFDGFKQGADTNLAKPVVALFSCQTTQPGEVHDFKYMAGGMRHRDDVIAESVFTDFRLHGAHDIEDFQCLAGVV